MEQKERILETAIKMFAENGIKSVRMDDIANQCGISKRTLYELFTDRENLIRQSLEHWFVSFEQTLSEKTKDAENILEESWITMNCSSEFRKFTKPVLKDIIRFYPSIMNEFIDRHRQDILDANQKRFRRGVEQGVFEPGIDIDMVNNLLTNYFYGLQRELMVTGLITDDDMDICSLNFIVIIFLRGIATEKGRRYIDEHMLNQI